MDTDTQAQVAQLLAVQAMLTAEQRQIIDETKAKLRDALEPFTKVMKDEENPERMLCVIATSLVAVELAEIIQNID